MLVSRAFGRFGVVALVLLAAFAPQGPAQSDGRMIAPGATYERIVDPRGPWVIDIVRIDRAAERLELRPTLGHGVVRRNQTLPGQLPPATDGARPVAGVNGDFFVMTGPDAGTPIGPQIVDGRLVHGVHDRNAVLLGSEGRVALGWVGFQGEIALADGRVQPLAGVNQSPPADGVSLYTPDYDAASKGAGETVASLRCEGLPITPNGEWKATVTEVGAARQATLEPGCIALEGFGAGAAFLSSLQPGDAVALRIASPGVPAWCFGAIGGGAILVKDGQAVASDNVRHPRTILGYSEREIVLVTVDGRRPGWSLGMTYTELAALLLDLGCADGINLDGGGSTTMWVRGEVMNRPSDGQPRSVSNGLALMLHGPVGPPARLEPDRTDLWGLPGAAVALGCTVTDADYNPLGPDAAEVRMECSPPARRLEDGRVLLETVGDGAVKLVAGQAETVIPVHVLAKPAEAVITPPLALAMPGDALSFSLGLLGPERQPLAAPGDGGARFALDPAVGSVSDGGEVLVVEGATSGVLRAEAFGVSAEARIEVAQPLVLCADGGQDVFRCTAFPEQGPTGAVRAAADAAGNACVALDYALGDAEATRAVYARMDRNVGRAIGFSAAVRAEGPAPWVRLAYIDGNGTRTTVTLAERVDWGAGEWRIVSVRLPNGVKAPVVLESIYVVETDQNAQPAGTLYLDDVTVWTVAEEGVARLDPPDRERREAA